MTSMTQPAGGVTGGVDTHGLTHHAAVIDALGRHLGDREFPATTGGYRDLVAWIGSHGPLTAVGVEGTGAYGAELARILTAAGIGVVDVDRPDRKTRRAQGKSDPIDAYAAAHAVASGRATGTPKSRTGTVEATRVLRVARRGAVKSRTQAMNQIRGVLVSAPAELRERFTGLDRADLVRALARLRPGDDLSTPLAATKAALRRMARRHQAPAPRSANWTPRSNPSCAPPPPNSSRSSASAPRPPANSWPPPGTTPNACAARPRSRTCAGPTRTPPPPDAPTATASTAAATGPPTPPSTPSS